MAKPLDLTSGGFFILFFLVVDMGILFGGLWNKENINIW
jgi:hypothetical protein